MNIFVAAYHAFGLGGSVTRIGVIEFLVLQFPVGGWLPGRTFDRWMTCPGCRHRTWTSVSFTR